MKTENEIYFYQKDMQKKQILRLFATILLFEKFHMKSPRSPELSVENVQRILLLSN